MKKSEEWNPKKFWTASNFIIVYWTYKRYKHFQVLQAFNKTMQNVYCLHSIRSCGLTCIHLYMSHVLTFHHISMLRLIFAGIREMKTNDYYYITWLEEEGGGEGKQKKMQRKKNIERFDYYLCAMCASSRCDVRFFFSSRWYILHQAQS